MLVLVARRIGEGISRPVRHVTDVAEAMAAGDLTRRTDVGRTDEIGRLGAAVNRAIEDLTVQRDDLQREHDTRQQQLQNTHVQQQRAEEQIRTRAQELIDRTAEDVRGELDLLVGSVAEVHAGAATIDDRAERSTTATQELVVQAAQADELVTSLGQSLRRVAGIADLIAGVASQTNLLALNATIEAARAGEAGRGFSVVAGEVKALAQETAHSSGEITATIAVLEQSAHAVAASLATMGRNVAGIHAASDDVRLTTLQQREVVARMEHVVRAAVSCIDQLADVTGNVERRKHTRVLLEGVAVLQAGGRRVEVGMVDLHESGMACTAPGPLGSRVGERVDVELRFGDRPTTVHAEVRRYVEKDGRHELGLMFLQPGSDVTGQIRQHLHALLGTDVL